MAFKVCSETLWHFYPQEVEFNSPLLGCRRDLRTHPGVQIHSSRDRVSLPELVYGKTGSVSGTAHPSLALSYAFSGRPAALLWTLWEAHVARKEFCQHHAVSLGVDRSLIRGGNALDFSHENFSQLFIWNQWKMTSGFNKSPFQISLWHWPQKLLKNVRKEVNKLTSRPHSTGPRSLSGLIIISMVFGYSVQSGPPSV